MGTITVISISTLVFETSKDKIIITINQYCHKLTVHFKLMASLKLIIFKEIAIS